MPTGFRFRKLYADLVCADGTVCIAYIARLQALGFDRTIAGVELYEADGRRGVLRALPPPPLSAPADIPSTIRLELARGGFELACDDPLPSWAPIGGVPAPGLRWFVLTPRATMRVRWTAGSGLPDLDGTGYMDWVELQRPTRWTGIETLQWGRLHMPDSAIVFTGVRDRGGGWWRRLAHWSADQTEPRVVDDFRLERAAAVRLSWASGGHARSAMLLPGRALHEGTAVDHARSPGLLERATLRLITGPSAETRWLSRVAETESGRDSGVALHEEVRFGR